MALATALGLALLGMGLRVGGTVLVTVAALLAAVSIIVISRLDLTRATLAATCACAFLTAMEPVHVGPLRLRSGLLLVALVLAVLTQIGTRLPPLPWWIWTLAGAVILSTALVELAPISQLYLVHRFNESAALPAGASGSAARIVLTVLGLPAIVVVCSMHFKRAPLWISIAYVSGNAISALAAYTDYLGVTSLSKSFGGCGVTQSRACGFAEHPVLLTIGTVYAIGIAAWFLVQSNLRYRAFGGATVLMLVLGTYASGTRGGELCCALAIAASVLLLPQYRRHIHYVALATALAVAIVFVAFPNLGHTILLKSRLFQNENASASNHGRIEAMLQGWHDFLHSPVYGIGMHVLLEAHNGYLQSLAAGGLIFLAAVLALQFGSLVSAIKLVKVEPFALALAVTALTRIGYDLLEGALVSAVSMVPVSLVAGIRAQWLLAKHTPEGERAAVHMQKI